MIQSVGSLQSQCVHAAYGVSSLVTVARASVASGSGEPQLYLLCSIVSPLSGRFSTEREPRPTDSLGSMAYRIQTLRVADFYWTLASELKGTSHDMVALMVMALMVIAVATDIGKIYGIILGSGARGVYELPRPSSTTTWSTNLALLISLLYHNKFVHMRVSRLTRVSRLMGEAARGKEKGDKPGVSSHQGRLGPVAVVRDRNQRRETGARLSVRLLNCTPLGDGMSEQGRKRVCEHVGEGSGAAVVRGAGTDCYGGERGRPCTSPGGHLATTCGSERYEVRGLALKSVMVDVPMVGDLMTEILVNYGLPDNCAFFMQLGAVTTAPTTAHTVDFRIRVRGGMQAPAAGAEMHGTLRTPPAWDPNMEPGYSFRHWSGDILMWSLATDVPQNQQGPAIVLRLGGLARQLAREVDPNIIANGQVLDLNDGNGPQPQTGVTVLLRGLARRFAALDVENSIKAIAELMSFRRQAGESVDQTLARFDVTRHRAEQQANFQLGPTGFAWLLLNSLGVPPALWSQFLQPFQGNIPQTEDQLQQLIGHIRRQGHLYENRGIQQAGRQAQHQQQHNTHLATTYFVDPWSTPGGDPWSNAQHAQLAQQPVYPASAGDHGWGHYTPTQQPPPPAPPTTSLNLSQSYMGGCSGVCCQWCGVAYQGEDADIEFDTDTEDEDVDDPTLFADYSHLTAEELGPELLHEYLMARRRWRKFSGRGPRRFRRRARKGKGKGYGRRWLFAEDSDSIATCSSCCEPVPPTFAGKAMGKGRKGNPRGKDGQPLKCSHCGSAEHLWRNCRAPGADEFRARKAQQHRTSSSQHVAVDITSHLAGVQPSTTQT